MYFRWMPLSYKKRQQKLTFDALMQTLSQEFERLPDHRRNTTSYPLADVLRSAFAMFSPEVALAPLVPRTDPAGTP